MNRIVRDRAAETPEYCKAGVDQVVVRLLGHCAGPAPTFVFPRCSDRACQLYQICMFTRPQEEKMTEDKMVAMPARGWHRSVLLNITAGDSRTDKTFGRIDTKKQHRGNDNSLGSRSQSFTRKDAEEQHARLDQH